MDDVYLEIIYNKIESKKNSAIKNILNIIDVSFDPEEHRSRKRQVIRKVVMDEINDLYRFVIENGSENGNKRE